MQQTLSTTVSPKYSTCHGSRSNGRTKDSTWIRRATATDNVMAYRPYDCAVRRPQRGCRPPVVFRTCMLRAANMEQSRIFPRAGRSRLPLTMQPPKKPSICVNLSSFCRYRPCQPLGVSRVVVMTRLLHLTQGDGSKSGIVTLGIEGPLDMALVTHSCGQAVRTRTLGHENQSFGVKLQQALQHLRIVGIEEVQAC